MNMTRELSCDMNRLKRNAKRMNNQMEKLYIAVEHSFGAAIDAREDFDDGGIGRLAGLLAKHIGVLKQTNDIQDQLDEQKRYTPIKQGGDACDFSEARAEIARRMGCLRDAAGG